MSAPDHTSPSGLAGPAVAPRPRDARARRARPVVHRALPAHPHRRLAIPAGDVGPLTIAGLVLGLAAQWLLQRPAGQPSGAYLGELLGAEAVLLMSIGLVLITTLPWTEAWFDGIDRAAIWHRRVAMAGLVLLLPHVLLATNPHPSAWGPKLGVLGLVGLIGLIVWAVLPRWRSILPRAAHRPFDLLSRTAAVRVLFALLGGYERWRVLHRTTGLFVLVGFLHGLLDGTPFSAAPGLRITYVAIGAAGLAAYAYRELLAPWIAASHDYQVAGTRRITDQLLEVSLRPLGRPLHFAPGQFAIVHLEARDGWHRHPFTISSGAGEDVLRVTIKALGDATRRLPELVASGMPAVVSGPHGRFDRRRGTPRQAWVAAGVGVAPFLSWVRSLDGPLPGDVDLYYVESGPAPFAAELATIAGEHPELHLHVVDSGRDGRLSPAEVIDRLGAALPDASVFMCGPDAMLRDFAAALRGAGMRRTRIHRERFDWR